MSNYMVSVYITNSGNCNFAYISGLCYFTKTPEQAMAGVLTIPVSSYYTKPVKPGYRIPQSGMYLFAQGSEDPVKTNPYAPNFRAYIEQEGLGSVTEISANNPLHNGKVGILYVWVINREACEAWWKKHVGNKKDVDAVKKEVK
jgi:hypothetical protein